MLNITKKCLEAFPSGSMHSENFIGQWVKFLKDKPVDENFVLSYIKFGPLYNKIKSSPALTACTQPLSWFVDNYIKILESTEEKIVALLQNGKVTPKE